MFHKNLIDPEQKEIEVTATGFRVAPPAPFCDFLRQSGSHASFDSFLHQLQTRGFRMVAIKPLYGSRGSALIIIIAFRNLHPMTDDNPPVITRKARSKRIKTLLELQYYVRCQ